jgi:hypothetical protein
LTAADTRSIGHARFRSIVSTLVVLAFGSGFAAPAQADHTPIDPNCRLRVEAIFWTGSDWGRLGQALAANANPCADYYISLPPVAGDKTKLRMPSVFGEIRSLGPHFHPLAEVTLGGPTGWAKWVEANAGIVCAAEEIWLCAGIEFRKRMAAAGLDVGAGETWLLNELNCSTRRDAPCQEGETPYLRTSMRQLVRGLDEADGTLPPSEGAAEIGINFSHQNLPDVPGYKRELKAWLGDAGFWVDMARHVRWTAREVYADTRFHSVPGSSRGERRRHLTQYQQHTLELVEAGPRSTRAARVFLRRTYLPLANAGWVALGGDEFAFAGGHGNTEVSPEQMMHFVSEQVHAIRRYGRDHRKGAPAQLLGFSWQPFNRFELPPVEFAAARDAIAGRIARAIQFAYAPGGSRRGACTPPRTAERWCRAEREGAVFTEAWKSFSSWQ